MRRGGEWVTIQLNKYNLCVHVPNSPVWFYIVICALTAPDL